MWPDAQIPLLGGVRGGLKKSAIYDDFEYIYDAENRMSSAMSITPTTDSKKVEAGYDYQGRRVWKKVYTYTAGTWELDTTKTFTYDGWNVIQETTTGNSTNTNYYVWGLDLSGSLQGAGGIGGLLLWKKDNGTFFYLYDANGNIEVNMKE
ncbi:MAG: hypothetical protein JW896_12990 [Deltaproteobacteria bacterium]|nr:hypothetical protein [Deltaproteobacteria bacterium]